MQPENGTSAGASSCESVSPQQIVRAGMLVLHGQQAEDEQVDEIARMPPEEAAAIIAGARRPPESDAASPPADPEHGSDGFWQ